MDTSQLPVGLSEQLKRLQAALERARDSAGSATTLAAIDDAGEILEEIQDQTGER